jgi:hypothetical protein
MRVRSAKKHQATDNSKRPGWPRIDVSEWPAILTPGFLRLESCLGSSPRSSINPKTQQKSDFVNANRRSVREDRRICRRPAFS